MKKTRSMHKLIIGKPLNESRISFDEKEYGGWYNIFDNGRFSGKAEILSSTLVEDWMYDGYRLFKKSNSDFKTINKTTAFFALWYTVKAVVVKTIHFKTSEVLANGMKRLSVSEFSMDLLSIDDTAPPFRKMATMIFKYGIYGHESHEEDLDEYYEN